MIIFRVDMHVRAVLLKNWISFYRVVYNKELSKLTHNLSLLMFSSLNLSRHIYIIIIIVVV